MINWIMENKEALITIVTGLVTVASIIAKMTPTETDNKVVGYVLKFVDMLAMNNKPTEIRGK